MATSDLSRTVTLSGSFTPGPNGGLLPARPSIRSQDLPISSNIQVNAPPIKLAIIIPIVVVLGIVILGWIALKTCHVRWRRKAKGRSRLPQAAMKYSSRPLRTESVNNSFSLLGPSQAIMLPRLD